jgi:hypothetical protein
MSVHRHVRGEPLPVGLLHTTCYLWAYTCRLLWYDSNISFDTSIHLRSSIPGCTQTRVKSGDLGNTCMLSYICQEQSVYVARLAAMDSRMRRKTIAVRW